MRIVFFGSGEFGIPTLQALREQHSLALVVTQPDRPAGRARQLTPTPVAAWAESHQVPLIKPEKVNAPQILQRIREAQADAHVVIAFGQKIGPEIIASPRLGRLATVNLHASLLPKYRGAAPIHWAILRGESVTGNTVFALVDRMDAGEILGQDSTPIDPLETTGELHDRLALRGAPLMLEVLRGLESAAIKPRVQDESAATLAPKLSRADAVIDFAWSAEELRRRVHGLTPWPGVRVEWRNREGGKETLLLRRVRSHAESGSRGEPGEMVGEGIVAAGSGRLELLEVQPPGKRVMTWEQFARGSGIGPGARLSGAVE